MVHGKYRPLDWSYSIVLWCTFHILPLLPAQWVLSILPPWFSRMLNQASPTSTTPSGAMVLPPRSKTPPTTAKNTQSTTRVTSSTKQPNAWWYSLIDDNNNNNIINKSNKRISKSKQESLVLVWVLLTVEEIGERCHSRRSYCRCNTRWCWSTSMACCGTRLEMVGRHWRGQRWLHEHKSGSIEVDAYA